MRANRQHRAPKGDRVDLLSVSAQAVLCVRPARRTDIAAVHVLLSVAQLPTVDLASGPGLRYWVLEAGDEVIGVNSLEWCGGAAALVRSLTVAPGYRGQGWGHELLSTLESEAFPRGIRQLVLLTTTARGFFAAHGYTVTARLSVPEELQQSEESGHCAPPPRYA